ncbi:MAG: YHS domain-containing (seleno)protein [Pseudomonadota bacterium]
MARISRRVLLAGGLGALAVTATAVAPAHAGKPQVYQNRRGVAIDGTDPVAYFTQGRPVAGSPDITTEWNGATWRFASAANRDAFRANPARYAPQFGGYCAWAVSQGYTASTTPEAWAIVDDRLYLNFSKGVQRRWARDAQGHIRSGRQNWPSVLN